MNLLQLQPFVPSEWCLACRRCCRYAATRDVLAPTFSPEEVAWATAAGAQPIWFRPAEQPPAPRRVVPSPSAAAASQTVQLVPYQRLRDAQTEHHCPALDPGSHHCRIYAERPLDCQLYPFVLTRRAADGQRLHLGVDRDCPYVQHLGPSPALRDYGLYLAELLASPMGQTMLANNPAIAGRPRDEFWTVQPVPDPHAPAAAPAPAPPGFRPLEACVPEFSAALAAMDPAPAHLSAYSPAAWLAWRDVMRLWWGPLDGDEGDEECGCLLAEQAGGYFLALPPLATPLTAEIVQRAFALLAALNGGQAVSRIENLAEAWAEPCRAWGYTVRPTESEYLYARDALRRRRAAEAQRARRTHRFVVRPFQATDADACLRLYVLWALRRQAATADPQARAMLRDGFLVHRRWLTEADALAIRGWIVEMGGEVQGYTLGAELTATTFVVLAEVVNDDYSGVSDLLTDALCQSLEHPWINTMGDAGLETLRQLKLADHPQAVLPVYTAVER